jgi:hypothetical protein
MSAHHCCFAGLLERRGLPLELVSRLVARLVDFALNGLAYR